MQQEKHSFAFGEASVLSRAHDKMARLVLGSWSSVGTINRAIDLHPAFQALRTRLQSVQTGPTVLASELRLLQQLSPSQQGEGASWRSHDERETSPHRRAQTAKHDSHMQRQLISPSDNEPDSALLFTKLRPEGLVSLRKRYAAVDGVRASVPGLDCFPRDAVVSPAQDFSILEGERVSRVCAVFCH
nr:unnamed protein product [Spirometra erinaceieuropaei]